MGFAYFHFHYQFERALSGSLVLEIAGTVKKLLT